MSTETIQTKKNWNAPLLIAYLIGFFLLWEMNARINFQYSTDVVAWIRLGDLIVLGAVLSKLEFQGKRWYWAIAIGIIIMIISAVIRSEEAVTKTRTMMNRIVLAYLLCPAVGMLISGSSLKTYLKIFIAVWTVIYVVFCILGLYAVANGIRIMNYTGKYYIGLKRGALLLFDGQYNNTSSMLTIVIMMTIVGAALAEKRLMKVLCLLASALMIICLSMTGGRSGELSTLLGTGIAVASMLQKPMAAKISRKWLRTGLSFALILIIAAIGLKVFDRMQSGINTILNHRKSVMLVPTAQAESETETETEKKVENIRERSFFQSNFLTDREKIWKGAFEALRKKPILLLTGTSFPTLMEDLHELAEIPDVNHLHNKLLQILVTGGIFALLASLVFLFYAIRAAWRLIFDIERPLWERLMPLPFIGFFLLAQVGALRVTDHTEINGLMMVFTGISIVLASRKSGIRSNMEARRMN